MVHGHQQLDRSKDIDNNCKFTISAFKNASIYFYATAK